MLVATTTQKYKKQTSFEILVMSQLRMKIKINFTSASVSFKTDIVYHTLLVLNTLLKRAFSYFFFSLSSDTFLYIWGTALGVLTLSVLYFKFTLVDNCRLHTGFKVVTFVQYDVKSDKDRIEDTV